MGSSQHGDSEIEVDGFEIYYRNSVKSTGDGLRVRTEIEQLGWILFGWGEDRWGERLGSGHFKEDIKQEVSYMNLKLRGKGWAKDNKFGSFVYAWHLKL